MLILQDENQSKKGLGEIYAVSIFCFSIWCYKLYYICINSTFLAADGLILLSYSCAGRVCSEDWPGFTSIDFLRWAKEGGSHCFLVLFPPRLLVFYPKLLTDNSLYVVRQVFYSRNCAWSWTLSRISTSLQNQYASISLFKSDCLIV